MRKQLSEQACRHQLLRRTFETANSKLTRLFRIKKGTLVSRYLQLYNAFFVSALIHHIGALNMPYSPLVEYQFYFFMIQPVAITIEDFAIHLGKKAGLKKTCTIDSLTTFASGRVILTLDREDESCWICLGGRGLEFHPPLCNESIYRCWFVHDETSFRGQIQHHGASLSLAVALYVEDCQEYAGILCCTIVMTFGPFTSS